jgi:CheY-like chemotaxis protein
MPRKKILLVDDSRTALMVQSIVLNQLAYDLVTACDGEDAVQKAVRERPDLILMDVVMPKMSGFDACRELRKREETRSTPIIMLTTRGEAENVEAGFSCGCNDYVTKPINKVELIEKLKNHLGG